MQVGRGERSWCRWGVRGLGAGGEVLVQGGGGGLGAGGEVLVQGGEVLGTGLVYHN